MEKTKRYVIATLIKNGYRYTGLCIDEDIESISIKSDVTDKVISLPKSQCVFDWGVEE